MGSQSVFKTGPEGQYLHGQSFLGLEKFFLNSLKIKIFEILNKNSKWEKSEQVTKPAHGQDTDFGFRIRIFTTDTGGYPHASWY